MPPATWADRCARSRTRLHGLIRCSPQLSKLSRPPAQTKKLQAPGSVHTLHARAASVAAGSPAATLPRQGQLPQCNRSTGNRVERATRPRSRLEKSVPSQCCAHCRVEHYPVEPHQVERGLRSRRISAKPSANHALAAVPAPAQNHFHFPPARPAPAIPTAPTARDAGESSHRRQTAESHRLRRPRPACPSAIQGRVQSCAQLETASALSQNTPAREWQPRACAGESTRMRAA